MTEQTTLPPLISQERIESGGLFAVYLHNRYVLISQERIESWTWQFYHSKSWPLLISQERIERHLMDDAVLIRYLGWSRKRELKGRMCGLSPKGLRAWSRKRELKVWEWVLWTGRRVSRLISQERIERCRRTVRGCRRKNRTDLARENWKYITFIFNIT